MFVRSALLAAALALSAAPAWAELRQHGNLLYELPPDWFAGTLEDGVQPLLYDGPEERCRFCILHLGPGAPAQDDLAGWLAAQSPGLVDPESRGSIAVMQDAQLSGTDPRPFATMAFTAGDDVFVTFGLQAGDRYQLLGFQGWAVNEEETRRSLASLQAEVVPLLDRLHFVTEGAEPLLPEAVPGSLSGLWWGWWLRPDDMTMSHRHLVLWLNGRFYDGIPPAGLQPLDPDAMALAPDPDWGVYRETGGTLELYYADGRTEILTAQGEGWSDGPRTLTPVEPLPDGTPLSGSVASFSVSSFAPGSGIKGNITPSSSMTFFGDGTYAGEGSDQALGTLTDGGGPATGGTYEVRDGLVLMRPGDGSEVRAALVFRLEDGGIVVGDQVLEAE